MGSAPCSLNYDFRAARQRRDKLVMLYRQGRKLYPDDPEWGWELIAQIEEIDREIAEAHSAKKSKMAVRQDGHSPKSFENVITPILPQWLAVGKEK